MKRCPSDCYSNFRLQPCGRYAWFEASTTVWMGSSLLWDMAQRWSVSTYLPAFRYSLSVLSSRVKQFKKKLFWTAWSSLRNVGNYQ